MDEVVLLLGVLLLVSASQRSSSPIEPPEHDDLHSEAEGMSSECPDANLVSPEITKNMVTALGVQYTLHAEALPWVGAVHACARTGARLAVPRSRREAELLGQLLRTRAAQVSGADTRDAMYVGISDIATGDWATLDGQTPTAVGYDTWLGNRSGKADHHNCVVLLPNGFYIRSDCGSRLAFACEKSSEVEGYVEVPGLGKYRVHTDPLPWVDALQTCKSEGASLAVPISGLETGFLAGYFIFGSQDENIRKNGLFVGISDIADEGTWQTVTGVDVDSNNCTWDMQGSDSGRTANCGVLQPNGKFADHPCEDPLAFCCKESRFPKHSESDSEYKTIEGAGKYRLHRDKATWLAAALKCLEENATLATPHSSEVENQLWAWLSDERISGDSRFHIGVHDIDGDGTYETLLGYSDEEKLLEALWSEYPKGEASTCMNLLATNDCSSECRHSSADRFSFVPAAMASVKWPFLVRLRPPRRSSSLRRAPRQCSSLACTTARLWTVVGQEVHTTHLAKRTDMICFVGKYVRQLNWMSSLAGSARERGRSRWLVRRKSMIEWKRSTLMLPDEVQEHQDIHCNSDDDKKSNLL